MAELDVQPKTNRPWWIWLLLALIVVAFLFLFRNCGNEKVAENSLAKDSLTVAEAVTTPNWDIVDFDAPVATYEEITDSSISVRGNDEYTIYGLGENILFATNENSIQPDAEKQLKQISSSLNKRFKNVDIAVYGNTDATGNADQNKALGEKRAEAVKEWLIKNGNIDSSKITIHSKGQSDPVASNATAKGRHMNRRVEIVAMRQTDK
jgi:outer membrane protein OmpA-like peptidoglycan-associated protein